MADEDDKNLDKQDAAEVDESQAQDETANTDESTSTETDDADNQAGADEQSDDDESSSFEKRFTQFKGETPEEYLKNLEQGYDNSSKEAVRLKKQLDDLRAEKLSAVANADDSQEDKSDQTKPQSMAEIYVNQEMTKRHKQQYAAFAEKHPEVDEDDALFQQLDEETGKYMDYVFKTQNRIPELGEALEFSWKILKPEDSKDSKDERVASAVKNNGAASKSKSVSKDAAKPLFSEKAIEAAKKIDPTLRGKSRTEIEEILSKYK